MGEQTSDRTGDNFGPYRLDSLIGRGGMGEVYRAHDTVKDRDVALKLLNTQLAQDPTFQERFRRECQTLARLGEPHIIPIHDFGEIDGTLFLDMRLVDGSDLRAVLRDRGALDPEYAVGIVEQVAAGLDAAHSAGLVHRDVKPENVLVTEADFAYLVDFGVAHADNDTHLTRTGTAVGSVAYMSPEQFEDSPVTASSDVYALAAMLFELLTARQPYPGSSITTVMRGVLFDEVPVASSVNARVQPAMDAVLVWGLAKKPADRASSAGEFAKAARRALSGEAPDVAGDSATTIVPAQGAQTQVKKTDAVSLGKPHPAVAPTQRAVTPPPTPPAPPVPPIPAGRVPSAPHGYPQVGYSSYPSGQVPVAPQSRWGTGNIALLTVLVLLVAILLGGGAWLLADKLGSSDDDVATAGNTAVEQATDEPTDAADTTVEQTTTAATYTPGPPPPDNQECADGVGTGYPQWTGCEFAMNVRDSYLAAGPNGESRTINGWAPQMRKNFVMECGPYSGIVACRGGNQAVVYIY